MVNRFFVFLIWLFVLILSRSTAAQACNGIAPPETSRRLFDKMAYDGAYDETALKVCESLNFKLAIESCKSSIRFGRFNSKILNEICKKFEWDAKKQSCLESAKNIIYFDRAVDLCLAMASPFQREQCLEGLKNKTFEASELSKCEKESSDILRSQCIERQAICLSFTP